MANPFFSRAGFAFPADPATDPPFPQPRHYSAFAFLPLDPPFHFFTELPSLRGTRQTGYYPLVFPNFLDNHEGLIFGSCPDRGAVADKQMPPWLEVTLAANNRILPQSLCRALTLAWVIAVTLAGNALAVGQRPEH